MTGIATAACAAALLLAACGPAIPAGSGNAGSTGGPGGTASTPPPSLDACTLITGTEIDQVMGQHFPALDAGRSGPNDCGTAIRRPDGRQVNVEWMYYNPDVVGPGGPGSAWATQFLGDSRQPGGHDVSGLGDAAACRESADLALGYLGVIVGRVAFRVQADTCTHAGALARIALGRLPKSGRNP
jgi:hypothetical protein